MKYPKNKELNIEILDNPFLGENEKYYFIYSVYFENGLFYKGYHTTKNLNDRYVGSSKNVKKLVDCDINIIKMEFNKFAKDLTEVGELEKIHIGDDWKNDENCLNEVPGGCIGGWQLLPKEVLDEYRRQSFKKYRERNYEEWLNNCKIWGIKGAIATHSEKTTEGKSLMIAKHNQSRSGKIKIRKEWHLITDEDKKLFPRIHKRIENEFEFGSAMVESNIYFEKLQYENWYRPEWKTKGKKIHTAETKAKISKKCSEALTGIPKTEEHRKNLSMAKLNKRKEN